MKTHSTIAAISTFAAESAIGVIRISGRDTFSILSEIFRFASSKKRFDSVPSHTIHLGTVFSGDKDIDEVLVSVFKDPASYTGEDMAEISCHGNPLILDSIMNLLLEHGCSAALPGEFTKRSFLNGKIDLSRAEAVTDLISAKNSAAIQISLNQLRGKEQDAINELRNEITSLLSALELEIDFAHEDTPKLDQQTSENAIISILRSINRFILNADEGMMLKNGIKLVITGKPNTGKSSLLNILTSKDKAIVTHIPGTTRDIIEDTVTIEGLPFRIFDTAGIRRSEDIVEKEGIKRSIIAADSADIILLVLDSSSELDSDDMELFDSLKDKNFITVLNKNDLESKLTPENIKFIEIRSAYEPVFISALDNTGINNLTNLIKNTIINKNFVPVNDIIIANNRHKEALLKARAAIENGLKSIKNGLSHEFTSSDVKDAVTAVSEITGDVSSEDILDNIFKNFCIGK